MSSALFDYEWQFLVQMIMRVTYCENYTEACETLLRQLRTLIPYNVATIFRTGRKDGQAVVSNPISIDSGASKSDDMAFMNGEYPRWSEFIMSPYSMVFRQSDLIAPSKWENTRVYQDIWKPKGIFWGLFMSVVSNDHPLIMLCIHREKREEDFSARDIYLMNTLKDPLERKFYNLLEEEQKIGPNSPPGKLSRTAASYGLTKRETEIVYLVCAGKSSEDICSQLFITPATLSKHLSNIYSKTKVRNRTQLFGLFHEV